MNFQNTPTGQIPADWETASLGQICDLSKESIDPSAFPDELFEYYSIPAFQEAGQPTITPGRDILSQKLVVKDDTVLFGKLNPRVPKVWRVSTRTPYRKIASTEFIPLSPCNGLNVDFLTFLCWSSHVMDVAKGLVSGSTPSRQRVDPSSFSEIEVPFPSLPEQRSIAAVLSKIQAEVEVQDKIVATLKELKAATMAKLFREGLRGESLKQTEIGEIPESWEVVLCETLCETISVGIVVTPAKYYVPAGVPCFRSFNVQEDRLLEKDFVFISEAANDLHGKSQLRTGDVIIVRTGYPGTACVVPEKYDGANCIDLIFARPNQQVVLSDYLARYINSSAGKRQVLFAQGGLAQQHFNVGALKRMAVALPFKEEQAAISRVGCFLDGKIIAAEAKLSSLRDLFSSMLHLLMTGQVRVTPKMIALQAVADWERKRKRTVGTVDKKIIEEIVHQIVELVSPQKIILFGSAAKGEMGTDSDLDFLVVKSCENRREMARTIYKNLKRVGIPIDIVVATPQDIEHYKDTIGLIYRPALREGKIVYAA